MIPAVAWLLLALLPDARQDSPAFDACALYTLEEFAGCQRALDRSGMPGLRVTRIQHYKTLYERQQSY